MFYHQEKEVSDHAPLKLLYFPHSIRIRAYVNEKALIYQLILLPFCMLLVSEFLLQALLWLIFHQPLLDF